ncbi:hypothetical protein [Sneathiella sp. HT1-7]|uniref:hypothetical protein n=1 Tax=Sneathiella sp. HT1-7 TaxID=2887192 RepID=UPI001D15A708|nr:hypothetical protein [Sneathiella sp. HT1-7]MCC3305532.1 hypothetical protein [Sneathiella sp. HT1-7]
MEKLLDIIEINFDAADGWLRIVDADWYSDDLRIYLAISFDEECSPQLWEISCSGVIEEQIASEYAETISLSFDSPLLMPFKEPHVELMFNENNIHPAELLGIVLSCCVENIGSSRYIHRFINQEPTVHGIVSSSFGLLGRFPETIASAIINALEKKSIRLSPLNKSTPKLWTGSEYVDYPKLEVLEIGNSYIIGTEFNAIRA